MINVKSSEYGELDAIDKFFESSETLHVIFDYFEPKVNGYSYEQNEIDVFGSFTTKVLQDWNEHVDLTAPTILNQTTLDEMMNFTVNNFYMDLLVDNSREVKSKRESEIVYCIIADIQKRKITLIENGQLPVIAYTASKVADDGILYLGPKLVSDQASLKKVASEIEEGYCITVVKTVHTSNSVFSHSSDRVKKTTKDKILGIVTKHEESFINTKEVFNIYYFKWLLDEHGIDEYSKPVELYQPVISDDKEKILSELNKIITTGKGSLKFSIEGIDNNGIHGENDKGKDTDK